MPLRIRELTYPTQVSLYYQILEEHRESVNDYGIYVPSSRRSYRSAAKHAMVIFYGKLIHCHLMYFSILKYSIKEFLSIAK
jgi:hypothetical protein